ncbi:MAG TPA: hypothetical protein VFC39_20545, partial [Acidobacteriaceae bacterium]|nr:hypothetical protein [Acidobacteriaceae bacterium]
SLRGARREAHARTGEAPVTVAAADPLNLAGILVPGDRIPAIPGRELQFQNGAVVEDSPASNEALTVTPKPKRTRSIADILRNEAVPTRPAPGSTSMELFS